MDCSDTEWCQLKGFYLRQNICRKYGFNRQQRMSFEDMLGQLKVLNPSMFWFLPINNAHPPLNAQLQPLPRVAHQNMGMRLVDVVANSSMVCTSERGIIERSGARVYDMKFSGNKFPLPHQLTAASGSPPTPDLPSIAVWLDVMAVFRRDATPYRMQYPLAPGVTYADHGRDLLARITRENQLCTTKGLVYDRPDLFANVTNRELATGSVRMINLMNIAETELPQLTPEELGGITLGPLSKDVTSGYLTSYQEQDAQVLQHGNYVDPDTFHQQASQVSQVFILRSKYSIIF